MTPANLSPLANHLWQSTLFAVGAWLITLALRKNRAAARHSVWLAASLKFLVPFSLLVDAGSRLGWTPSPGSGPVEFSRAVEQISEPFALHAAAPAAIATASRHPAPWLVLAVWLCGFAISAFVWIHWWQRFRKAVRAGSPLDLDLPIPVVSTAGGFEPGVFGIRKPILLLPDGICERLPPGQLQSILTHELCHVRRRDNLTAAIHMTVESIFWFHPLVWWIGSRLVEERERACDEEVVRLGYHPEVYAEGILNVCKFYLQSPLVCTSGVTGADLRKRIEAIAAHRPAPRLTAAGKALLATAGVLAIGTPVLIGIWRAPLSNAQTAPKLVFEVASIKRIDPDGTGAGPIPLAPGVTPGGGIRSRVSIFNLICWAYRVDGAQVSGGPSWIRTDRYAIEAKPQMADGPDDPNVPPSEQQTNRTRERVKALLADRFRLAVRMETRDAPVYVLSVAKGGHKMTLDPEGRGSVSFGGDVITGAGAPTSFLAVTLTQMLGRPVLDETGLDGRFKYKLEFRPEDDRIKQALAASGRPVADDDPRPSIFTAIKDQLGLELQSRKGSVPAVQVERIERPTEN